MKSLYNSMKDFRDLEKWLRRAKNRLDKQPPIRKVMALADIYKMNSRFLLIILLFFASCSPQKRISKLLSKHPGIAAVECAERFPVIETTDTAVIQDTALLLAYEQEFAYLNHLLDSMLSAGCDTVTVERVKELVKYQPLKPCPEKIVTVIKENTAKLQVLRDSCNRKLTDAKFDKRTIQADLSKQLVVNEKQAKKIDLLRKQRNTYMFSFWVLLLWIFRKPLIKLARKLITKF